MSKTIRHRIIDALEARLNDFTWAAFFSLDEEEQPQAVQPDVHVGRTIFDPDVDPLPLVTIVPGMEVSQRTRYGMDQISMQIDISALVSVRDGADVTSLAEPIFGDLRRAVFDTGEIELIIDGETNYFTLEYQGGGIADYPNDPGPAVITIAATVTVVYETATGDPYS